MLVLVAGLVACRRNAQEMPTATATSVLQVTATPTAAPSATSAPPTATAEATATAVATATATPLSYEPRFEPARCEFERPPGREVQCGYLVVPEERDNEANGNEVRLHVAIFASEAPSPQPDPVVYLEGGPGGDALESIPFVFEERFGPFLEERDLIVFDQRGTGYSEPALDCPEYRAMSLELLDVILTTEEEAATFLEVMGACRERLVTEGVALGAYDSAASAADVEDLRRALGYEQWNLYGISYGTRLALTVMRDYPQGVRSAILDSAYPLQANIVTETPRNFRRALDVFFAGCAADAACNEAYPELEPFFFDLVAQLNAEPIMVEVVHAFERERYDVFLTGEDLLGIVFQGLYSEEIIPLLPQMIHETAEGQYELLRGLLANLLISNEFISVGMNFSVQCQEEVAFSVREDVAAAVEDVPELRDYFETSVTSGELAFAACELWDVAAAPAVENEPVRSDIPALVLAGEYDPITPPAWSQEVQAGLENSYYFEFPGLGHGVSVAGPCPRAITLAFLENPARAPDGSCIAALAGPRFLMPQTEVVIERVPFTTDLFGLELSGVVPEGWEEVAPGVFARERTVLDPTFVLQQAVPGVPAQDVLELLVEQLDIEELPAQARTVNAGGKSWSLYETASQGTPVDIALSEDGGMALVVMLVSSEGERDVLYEGVYLPALERLEIG